MWLGLAAEAEVAAAFAQLEPLVAQFGGAVLAERMAAPGVELIVAARADAVVPALVVGLGGVWTEVLDDVAIVPLPADAARIERARAGVARRAAADRRTRRPRRSTWPRWRGWRSGSASSCSRSRSSCSSSTRSSPGRPARWRSMPPLAAAPRCRAPIGSAA